jgi:hypothetical protein
MPVTIVEVMTSTPRCSNWRRADRRLWRHPGQYARGPLDQDDPCAPWIDPSEVAREHATRNFGERSGQFGAGRSGTNDHEREPFVRDFGVRFALRGLVRDQDAPADFKRILERLETGRVAFPCVIGRSRNASRRSR